MQILGLLGSDGFSTSNSCDKSAGAGSVGMICFICPCSTNLSRSSSKIPRQCCGTGRQVRARGGGLKLSRRVNSTGGKRVCISAESDF